MAYYTEDEMKEVLAAAVAKAGSVAALAREIDVQQQFLGRVANGKDPISESLAERLGFRRLTVFEKIRKVAPVAEVAQ